MVKRSFQWVLPRNHSPVEVDARSGSEESRSVAASEGEGSVVP